jgi:hypothetical protein
MLTLVRLTSNYEHLVSASLIAGITGMSPCTWAIFPVFHMRTAGGEEATQWGETESSLHREQVPSQLGSRICTHICSMEGMTLLQSDGRTSLVNHTARAKVLWLEAQERQ